MRYRRQAGASGWIVAAVLLGVLPLRPACRAQEWPQWGGPRRDHVSRERGLLTRWPAAGPRRLWQAGRMGLGHSSPSVAGGTIYVSGMREKTGVVTALSLDGRVKWQKPYGPEFTGDRPGARSTPTVHDGRVYVLSGLGLLACLRATDGALLWSVDTKQAFGAQAIDWGLSESVLVDGENVICAPGGTQASVVAFDRKTGRVAWKTASLTDKSGYCSAIAIQRGPTRLIVTRLATQVVGLDARTGDVLWSRPDTAKNDVHGVSPIYHDGLLFYTNWDATLSVALRLSEDGRAVEEAWKTGDLANGYSGVVLWDGILYGSTDVRGRWRSVEFATGRTLVEAPGRGTLTCADGMLYAFAENGVVSLMSTHPTPFQVVSSFKPDIGQGPLFSHPVIANGRLYVRHGDALAAYALR